MILRRPGSPSSPILVLLSLVLVLLHSQPSLAISQQGGPGQRRICPLDDENCWQKKKATRTLVVDEAAADDAKSDPLESVVQTLRAIRRGAVAGYASAWLFATDGLPFDAARNQARNMELAQTAHAQGTVRALRCATFAALASGVPAALREATKEDRRWHRGAGWAMAVPIATFQTRWLLEASERGMMAGVGGSVAARALMGFCVGVIIPMASEAIAERRNSRLQAVIQRLHHDLHERQAAPRSSIGY